MFSVPQTGQPCVVFLLDSGDTGAPFGGCIDGLSEERFVVGSRGVCHLRFGAVGIDPAAAGGDGVLSPTPARPWAGGFPSVFPKLH